MSNTKDVFIMINSLTQGGAERVALRISHGLSKVRHNTRLVSVSNDIFYSKETININVLNQSIRINKLQRVISLYKFFSNKKKCTAICFSLDLSCYLILLRTLKLYNGKVICRFINNPDFEVGNTFIGKVKKKILFHLISKADAIICQSDAMKAKLSSFVENNNMVRIYNPIKINFEFNALTLSDKNHNKDKLIKLLYIGRFTHQKNIFDIIKVGRELENRKVNFLWTLVGDGELYNEFERQVDINGLNHRFHLTGAVDNVKDFYSEADMTTLVSHYEGLPNVLLESIASNVPCISYDCPTGPSEIIIDGENGALVKMYDIDAFTDAIIDIYHKEMKGTNIALTLNKFKYEKIIQEYDNLINSL
ncbi:group 1 glycosyl transferase [Enterobacter hormaechei]|uniref:Alpha-1,4-N-acetyl-D-galactosaminyltransferase n=1 Tax=Enterobacter cloacae TaxID=550 RepID=A0A6B9XWB4_ENTCL|nr:glycosyltransferase [Enterobacter hormaechei]QHR93345.1 alpha-1,4-N-acetyl-D-galactosaminyltransferase [Enterobacter cloacae]SQB50275.1 group 1 glycosyl transferase [Enterobacter hormaechei]